MMQIEFFQVDAFASAAFEGNPAGVCPLPAGAWPDAQLMQAIAEENNLSETAFFKPTREPDRFELRWFTPAVEVDLCGHATLASAHVLFSELDYQPERVRFGTRSGELSVRRGESGLLSMELPGMPPRAFEPRPDLSAALGAAPQVVLEAGYLVCLLDSETAVRELSPDHRSLRALPDYRHVIVTAAADAPDVDFVSRFFAPGAGVDEDPVTGSAHCRLVPFWAERLGKRQLAARQLSRRGGSLQCALLEDGRVSLAGRARTYLRGQLSV